MVKRKKQNRTKRPLKLPKQLRREDTGRLVYAGEHGRIVALSPAMRTVFEHQHEMFVEKFGREPGPADPIFFDPNADEPRPFTEDAVTEGMVAVAQEAGLPAAKIYAIRKTGMMIVEGLNDHLFSDEDKDEWQDAIDEFNAMN